MAASGYQQHVVMGNLGDDPVVTETRNGNLVANFDIAVNQRNRDGSEHTTWLRVAAWNGLAEVVEQYLGKGDLVLVEGTRVKASGWLDQEDNERATLELVATDIRLIEGANGYENHVLVGNLGADPCTFTTRAGKSVTNFDIAVNEENADGSEVTTWYRIAAWNGLGEICAAHLAKGRKVMVVGSRLSASAWTDRSGNLRTTLELSADTVKFLDSPSEEKAQADQGDAPPVGRSTRTMERRERKQAPRERRRPARDQVLDAIPF